MAESKLLLIDDDVSLTEMLKSYLEQQAYSVEMRHSGEAGLEYIKQHQVDLIILDIMMPGGMNGLETLPKIRALSQTPVIMLTGRGDDIDKIVGLEMGADDYLSKPCNPRELSARIQAVLRRAQLFAQTRQVDNSATTHHSSGLAINRGQRSITINGEELKLTSVEYEIFEYLFDHVGEAVSKDSISVNILGRELGPYDRSIDVHVSHLRNKLKKHQLSEQLIKTIRGQGYQLVS